MRFFPFIALLGLYFLPTACVVYREAPIDLQRDSAEWQKLSAALCPAGQRLTHTQMQHIGLLLNPELNKARLTYAKSTAVARYAGLWEDPSLSADLEHVLRENINNYSIAPSLSVPVTGLPRLARQVAEQYKESDYWRMVAQERQFVRDMNMLIAKLMVSHRKIELTEQKMKSLQEEQKSMQQLLQWGEVTAEAAQATNQRILDTEKESLEQGRLHAELHAQLTEMLGLHPDARRIEFAEHLPDQVPAARPIPQPLQLVELPQLKAELAAYGATETELKAEIRKQYPELSVSPTRTHEEGSTRLGAGVEFSIPLWNRNREGMARASGERRLQQHKVLTQWHSLQQEAASLADKQALDLESCRRTFAGLLETEAAVAHQKSLFEIGEVGLSEYAQSRYECYQRHLNYLDCLGALLEVQYSLDALNPDCQP